MSGAPVGPSLTLDEKKGRPGTTVDCTNAYSSTFGSPLSPRRHISANRAPAYAMDSVADPCAVPCQVLVPRKKNPKNPVIAFPLAQYPYYTVWVSASRAPAYAMDGVADPCAVPCCDCFPYGGLPFWLRRAPW